MTATTTEPTARVHRRGSSWRAAQKHHRRVRMWTRLALVAAALGAIGAITIVIALNGTDDAAPAVVPADIQLTLGDYFIAGDLEVAAGDVVLEAVNVGVQPHNVGIRRGSISTNLASGDSTRLDLGTLTAGTYELYCDIIDHVELGMVADLVVK